MPPRVHPTAHVHPEARIGDDAQIWHHVQIRERAVVGARCIIGQGAYLDLDVVLGDDCKVQNYACVFVGVKLGRGVFVGPCATFTNDLFPRAVNPDLSLKSTADWHVTETEVGDGASIGANATIKCGVRIGAWALVAAGSVVTKDVPDQGLVRGNPARLVGFVSKAGYPMKVTEGGLGAEQVTLSCERSGEALSVPRPLYDTTRTP